MARYLDLYGGLRLGACVAIAAVLWAVLLLLLGQHGVPRSVVVAYVPVGTAAVVLLRLAAASLLGKVGISVRSGWRTNQGSLAAPLRRWRAGCATRQDYHPQQDLKADRLHRRHGYFG